MSESHRETEIKLPFDSASEARARLERAGAGPAGLRLFEDNRLYDLPGLPLKAAGKIVRLRRVGDRGVLTFKAPVAGVHRHKVREEHECQVGDVEAASRILEGLGYSVVYRYQKYRTLFALEGLTVCLDETPIGCFVELEGDPEGIDRVAGKLGFTPRDYIRVTYRDLQEQVAADSGRNEPGDMVFGD